jgi:hypothetical protein
MEGYLAPFRKGCMSANNHRTWQNYHTGHFLLTIELDPAADGRNFARHQESASATRRLIAILDTHRVAGTWAVSDPAHSAATSLVLRSAEVHEIAILGDAHWVGATAGRTRFARELARRVAQARAAGLEVTTLVPRVESVVHHIDLVVKQGITAIAAPAGAPTAPAECPRALHYGVWELPIAAKLPTQARWFQAPTWSLWRCIKRAAREAATFHLRVDAPALADAGETAERNFAWLIRRVATLRDRGLVKIETMATTAARLSAVPAVSPQRSILRPAA